MNDTASQTVEILIPVSHTNDFLSHRLANGLTWWATMQDPGVREEDKVRILLPGGSVPYMQSLDAVVKGYVVLTGAMRDVSSEGKYYNRIPGDFIGWHILILSGNFVPPAPVWGDDWPIDDTELLRRQCIIRDLNATQDFRHGPIKPNWTRHIR